MSVPIAVFASGRGSNFEAIHRATATGALAARIVAVVSDRADAPVLSKAREAGIAALAIPAVSKREEHERAVLEAIESYSPRFLVLAGYMRLIGPTLLERFRSERGYHRVVNIHPSLLPAFPGRGSYRQAFEHGAKVSGVTIHLVDQTLDGGPICEQEAFGLSDCRTVEEVEARGLGLEHRLYPEVLSWVLPERFNIEILSNGRICVRKN